MTANLHPSTSAGRTDAGDYDWDDGSCPRCGDDGFVFECIDGCCLDADVGCDLCTRPCPECSPRPAAPSLPGDAVMAKMTDAQRRTIAALLDEEMWCGELGPRLGMSWATSVTSLSTQLTTLARQGFLSRRRNRGRIYYTATDLGRSTLSGTDS